MLLHDNEGAGSAKEIDDKYRVTVFWRIDKRISAVTQQIPRVSSRIKQGQIVGGVESRH